MEHIPVNIISGFLGSGKTTAIIKLFNQKTTNEEWAVIINEFGKISVDSQTLRSTTSNTGTVFDISGGCICCSAKGYFQENLEKIISSGNFSRILIEPSGLGGIDFVSEIVTASDNLMLMPVICLVDITMIENPRLQFLPIFRAQIAKADIIIFTKCDLLDGKATEDRLVKLFNSNFPDKQTCLRTSEPSLLPWILEMNGQPEKQFDKFRLITLLDPKLSDNNYHQEVYLYENNVVFDSEKLITLFSNHPSIIRAKGHIRTSNGWNLFNHTLSGSNFEVCQAKTKSEVIIISEKSPSGINMNLNEQIMSTVICKT